MQEETSIFEDTLVNVEEILDAIETDIAYEKTLNVEELIDDLKNEGKMWSKKEHKAFIGGLTRAVEIVKDNMEGAREVKRLNESFEKRKKIDKYKEEDEYCSVCGITINPDEECYCDEIGGGPLCARCSEYNEETGNYRRVTNIFPKPENRVGKAIEILQKRGFKAILLTEESLIRFAEDQKEQLEEDTF